MTYPFETSVAGVKWHQDDIAGVHEGDEVLVRPEPENEYDRHARAVLVKGHKIGYVPRTVAERLGADGVGDLAGVVTWRGGTTVLGVRVLVAPCEPVVTPGAALAAETEAAASTGRGVRVRGSGRRVGELVSIDRERGKVLVAGPRGPVEYPDDLVIIDEWISA